MSDDRKQLLGCALICSVPFVLVAGSLLNGWALRVLWNWFLVPMGAPAITLLGAIGIAIIVGFLQPRMTESKAKDSRSSAEILLEAFLWIAARPLIAVAWAATIRWLFS